MNNTLENEIECELTAEWKAMTETILKLIPQNDENSWVDTLSPFRGTSLPLDCGDHDEG